MSGLRLHHSNRLEVLAAELVRLVRADPGDPVAPERIVVPHPTIGRWLSLELARGLGIAANLRFEQPAEFAWAIMRAVVPDLPRKQPYRPERLRWRIHDRLPGPDGGPGRRAAGGDAAGGPLDPAGADGGARILEDAVGGYLRDGDPRKRVGLADRLARVYDQCLLYRPDWIREWEDGSTPHWQARLWQQLVKADGSEGARHAEGGKGADGVDEPVARDAEGAFHWVTALDRFHRSLHDGLLASRTDDDLPADGDGEGQGQDQGAADRSRSLFPSPSSGSGDPSSTGGSSRPPDWPRRASFFAVAAFSPSYLELLREAARSIEVHVFLLNPCREYWGDIRSRREIDVRAKGADPDASYLTEGNELLAAWGRAGRDGFDALLEVPGAESTEHFVEPDGAGRLAAVQRDILDLRLARDAVRSGPPPASRHSGTGPKAGTPAAPPDGETPGAAPSTGPLDGAGAPPDDSIQVHVCHSPMREAEVLHDRLLAVFDAHPDLAPADVLVLTPDLDTYGPAVEAVFAAAGRVPCNVARARAGESRTLDAFLALLSLPGSRHGATPVLAPLAAPAVRDRFGIGEADFATLRDQVRKAGIRWGVDGAHRGEEDLPETVDHTWRHGLRRLLLGYAMADADEPFAGLVPCGASDGGFDGGGAHGELLGRFVSYCEKVFGLRRRLGGRRPPEQWAGELQDVVRDFLADGSEPAPVAGRGGASGDRALAREQAGETAEVRALIQGFREEATDGKAPVPLEVVLDVLRERADAAGSGTARLADGVTVASLGAGRVFPAGVVCVVGMNDGVFPRSPSAPSFDLVAADCTLRGDRDLRHEDRYAFLEALLAARRCFLVTCTGRGLRDDAPIPPSVLVDELEDYLARRFPGEPVETRHPLQPFSPRYFAAPALHAPGEGSGAAPAPGRAAPGSPHDPDGGAGEGGGDGAAARAGSGAGAGDGAGTGTGGGGGTGAEAEDGTRADAGDGTGVGAEDGVETGGGLGTEPATATARTATTATDVGEDLFSYSRGMCEAASVVRGAATTGPGAQSRFSGMTLPEPEASRRRVDLAELVAFFANPARHLLRERLGMRLELDDLALEDEEPFGLDHLERFHLRLDIREQRRAGVEPERGAALLHGSGRLPQAGLGRVVHAQVREEVERLEGVLVEYRGALQAPPRSVDFALGDFRVTGVIEHVEPDPEAADGDGPRASDGDEADRAGGADDASGPDDTDDARPHRMVWYRMGKLRPRDWIEVRLRQLAWATAGRPPLKAVLIELERGSWKSHRLPPPDDASAELGRWLDVWWRGLTRTLPFFPEASMAFVDTIARRTPDLRDVTALDDLDAPALEKPREDAHEAWYGGDYRRGDRCDSWLALVHDTRDPLTPEFEDLAMKLLLPLARDRHRGRQQ